MMRAAIKIACRIAVLAPIGAGLAAASWCSAAWGQQSWAPVVAQANAGPASEPVTRAPLSAPRARPAPTPRAEASAPAPVQRLPLQVAAAATAAGDRARRGLDPPVLQTAAAKQYCANVSEPATEARFAWQRKVLSDMEGQVDKRIAVLEAKIVEYQKWVALRDEFAKRAQENLVIIYSRMRPDAAAMQLTAMDEITAAAVIVKLDPRVASTILNEMEPTHAARLSATIAGAARTTPSKASNPAPDGKKS